MKTSRRWHPTIHSSKIAFDEKARTERSGLFSLRDGRGSGRAPLFSATDDVNRVQTAGRETGEGIRLFSCRRSFDEKPASQDAGFFVAPLRPVIPYNRLATTMPFQATALSVMIASPSDVATEKEIIRGVLHDWNAIHAYDRKLILLPMGWETHASPKMGDRAQGIINKQLLDNCDLLVAVFWTRLGSPTGEAPSGTVEEINKHLDAGKPAMIYFSNAPVHPDSVDAEQYQALRKFREECKSRGLIEEFTSASEFRDKFRRQLMQTVMREFKETVGDSVSVNVGDMLNDALEVSKSRATPQMSPPAQQLLLEATSDQNGTILHLRSFGGTVVQTNGKDLVDENTARTIAKWENALEELLALALIQDRGHKGELYVVTHAGYEVADRIRQGG